MTPPADQPRRTFRDLAKAEAELPHGWLVGPPDTDTAEDPAIATLRGMARVALARHHLTTPEAP